MKTLNKFVAFLGLNFKELINSIVIFYVTSVTAIKNAVGLGAKLEVFFDVIISIEKMYEDSNATKAYIKSVIGSNIDERPVTIVTDKDNPINDKLSAIVHSMYPDAKLIDVLHYAFHKSVHYINLSGSTLTVKKGTGATITFKTINPV